MGPDDVTAERLSVLLGGEVGAVESEPIGDGLVGLNLRVRLIDAADHLPASVVLKLPSLDETSRATGQLLRNYEREVKFYRELAATVDIRVPHCHHAAWNEETGDFTLVLEDMAPAEQGDQLRGCSPGIAELAVGELAKLHGPRWDDPSLADVDWLTRRTGAEGVAVLNGLWETFFPPFLDGYARHLTTEAVDLAQAFGPLLTPWMDGREGPLAVTHGDYRLDNLLFGTAHGGPPVTVVDWQTPGHASPIADLSYFCGAGLVPADRAAHERSLLDHYAESLAAYGIDVDAGWLWEQYRRDAFGGVVMAVIASQVVGANHRSEALFATMASRHLQHAIDLDSLAAI